MPATQPKTARTVNRARDLCPHWAGARLSPRGPIARADVEVWNPHEQEIERIWIGHAGGYSRDAWGLYADMSDVKPVTAWPLTWFQSVKHRQGIARQYGQHTLGKALSAWRTGGKSTLPLWSPALYPVGATRAASAVVSLSCLVLDYDDGTPIHVGIRPWRWWRHLLYTTAGHTEAHHKYRVVLPLAQPVAAEHWAAVWQWAEERAGLSVDAACKDASRIYYIHGGPDRTAADVIDRLGPGLPLLLMDTERLPRRVKLPAVAYRVPVDTSGGSAAQRALLRTDAAARLRAAEAMGATVAGAVARRMECPRCGRRSVWYVVDPIRKATASCNHQPGGKRGDACGWYGSVFDLLVAVRGAECV